ncbi:MAG: DUF4157 domain-containing protein, partial [Chloroflexi bacterium]|nr:DUF4157 domain-containing protein [Chloroflexota bacterium]
MSKEQQTQQKQNKVQRPSPLQDQTPVAELTPAQTTLQNPAQLDGLPNHATSRSIRQATVLRMQQQQGNAAVQRMLRNQMKPGNNGRSVAGRTAVQTKLTVNEPGDKFEQEADQVADNVMRAESAAAPPPPDDEANNNGQPPISDLQASGGGVPDVSSETEQGIENLNGQGAPLPHAEQDFFEERMGADLSQVRVHTGSDAVQLSRDLQAKAFTVGPNIAFDEGAYQPGTSDGRRL